MAIHTSPLLTRLRSVAAAWARYHYEIVTLAAQLADGSDWVLDGAPTAAHWLAEVADVETCTAREWIRIGRLLRTLPASADAFEQGRISYSKLRTLTRLATPANETELLPIAERTPASALARELGRWLHRTHSPEEMAAHQRKQRGVRWRCEPDGMTAFTLRLEPLVAGRLIGALTSRLARTRKDQYIDDWPTVAQQYADALDDLVTNGAGRLLTEIVLHLRGDGATLDDGTPIPTTVLERIAPDSFIRVLIHDAERRPINASGRHRHPTQRQRRVVKERDRHCIDCGRTDLLQYDHTPDYEQSRRTVIDELELRCSPCHHRRHQTA